MKWTDMVVILALLALIGFCCQTCKEYDENKRHDEMRMERP